MKDKVSIIIPAFNRAKTIKRAILSCLNQSYNNIEVIVVDDGSIDKTKEVVKSIKDNRLKYYRLRTNKGADYARNYGINKSTGKYISFNDSDDEFLPNKIEKQLNNLINNKSDMDFCRIIAFDNDIEILAPSDEYVKKFNKTSIIELLCGGNFISTQAILVKKDVITKYMFNEELPRLQDYDLVLRMVPNIKVSFNDEILVNVYRQNDSISHNNDKLVRCLKIMLKKDYNLPSNLDNKLKDYLITFLENTYISKYNIEIEKLNCDIKNLNNVITEKNIDIDTLIRERDFYKISFNSVINSKRYKLIDKIFSIKKNK